jgi:hypothetical protein
MTKPEMTGRWAAKTSQGARAGSGAANDAGDASGFNSGTTGRAAATTLAT